MWSPRTSSEKYAWRQPVHVQYSKYNDHQRQTFLMRTPEKIYRGTFRARMTLTLVLNVKPLRWPWLGRFHRVSHDYPWHFQSIKLGGAGFLKKSFFLAYSTILPLCPASKSNRRPRWLVAQSQIIEKTRNTQHIIFATMFGRAFSGDKKQSKGMRRASLKSERRKSRSRKCKVRL